MLMCSLVSATVPAMPLPNGTRNWFSVVCNDAARLEFSVTSNNFETRYLWSRLPPTRNRLPRSHLRRHHPVYQFTRTTRPQGVLRVKCVLRHRHFSADAMCWVFCSSVKLYFLKTTCCYLFPYLVLWCVNISYSLHKGAFEILRFALVSRHSRLLTLQTSTSYDFQRSTSNELTNWKLVTHVE